MEPTSAATIRPTDDDEARTREGLDAMPRRDGKAADVVDPAAIQRRDIVGEAVVELACGLFLLLAKHVEPCRHAPAGLVGIDLDVVADRVARPESDDRVGREALLVHDPREKVPRVVIKLRGLGPDDPVLQDVGKPPVKLPRAEERPPVDVGGDFRESDGGKGPCPQEVGPRDVDGAPVGPLPALPRGRQREQRLSGAPRREFLPLPLLPRPHVGHEPGLVLRR